jgi:hypothetical protein
VVAVSIAPVVATVPTAYIAKRLPAANVRVTNLRMAPAV